MNSAILLVDDNVIQATARKAILEQAGARVTVATDGAAALEVLSHLDSVEKIGLVITDHLMPRMNGPELVLEIRRRGFEFPVLVLSGLPDAEESYENLSVTFRPKPFPPDSLIALVHELLGQRMRRTA